MKCVGLIRTFIVICRCNTADTFCNDCQPHYAIMQKYSVQTIFQSSVTKTYIPTMFVCNNIENGELTATPIDNLEAVCFTVYVNNCVDAIEPVNLYEVE